MEKKLLRGGVRTPCTLPLDPPLKSVGLNIFGDSNPNGCPKQYTVLSCSLNTLYFIVLSNQLG
jgi:hypothetical protein